MKRILFTLSIFVTLVSADYTIFKSQTKEIGKIVKTDKVFFGEYSSFSKKLSEGTDDGLKRALVGGITGGLSTAGLGLVIGIANNFIMSSKMDKKYLQVLKVEDEKGNIAFIKTLFIGSNDSDYTDEDVLKIITSDNNSNEVIKDDK